MKSSDKTGACCAAFGAGLLIATVCPTKFVLILVAIALIAAGCSCAKKC